MEPEVPASSSASEAPSSDLRSLLTEAVRTHEETPAAQSSVAPPPISTPDPAPVGERPRDASGRFIGAPPESNAAAPASAAVPPPPAAQEPSAAAPIPRPNTWKGGEVEKAWDQLPAPIQQEIQRREANFAKGLQQARGEAGSLLQAVEPYKADFQQYNVDGAGLVGNLLAAHRQLSLGTPQQKLQALEYVIQSYGVPMRAFFDPAARQQFLAQPQQQRPQPQQQQPQDVQSIVERTLLQREVQTEVGAISNDTAKYPAYSYVRHTMAQLIENGDADDLPTAYEMALKDPAHALIARAVSQPPAVDPQAQVRAARAAAVSPRSATPLSTSQPSGKQSLRDTIAAAAEKQLAGARV